MLPRTTTTIVAPERAVAFVSDLGDWQKNPMPVKAGESIGLELPRDAYLEYAFMDAAGKLFADPNNSRTTLNPLGPHNRAIAMPGYTPSIELAMLNDDAPKGEVKRLAWSSKYFSGTRRAYLYTPPNMDTNLPHPIFIVQDGVAYLRLGELARVMDVLLWRNQVRPSVLMFVEPQERFAEYWLNQQYLEFVAECLPLAAEHANISQDAQMRGMWGASMGGLISMFAGLKRSDVFGMVVSQSGAFQADLNGRTSNERPDGQREWLVEQFTENPVLPLRISMDCGQLEWLLGSNRRMAGALFDRGYTHQYFELPSGHNWTTWRNGLVKHLLFMFGK